LWDLAATEKAEFNDPDWTVGIKLGRDRSGGFWVMDIRQRANPCDVEKLLLDTATRAKASASGSAKIQGRPVTTRLSFYSCPR
jgi:phage terminase large subunit-like protein